MMVYKNERTGELYLFHKKGRWFEPADYELLETTRKVTFPEQ
jgi:hypothetical protein